MLVKLIPASQQFGQKNKRYWEKMLVVFMKYGFRACLVFSSRRAAADMVYIFPPLVFPTCVHGPTLHTQTENTTCRQRKRNMLRDEREREGERERRIAVERSGNMEESCTNSIRGL